MRAGVFSRYWSTGGGGEKYAGTIAEVLSKRFDTELLGAEEVDPAWLEERLRLDLSRTTFRVLDDTTGAVTEASAEHDLFVNMSYMSADAAATRRSIYVVMFPTSLDGHLSRAQRLVVQRLGGFAESIRSRMAWGTGFHPRGGGRRSPTWTDGCATLYFTPPPGSELPVELDLGYHRPPSLPTDVTIEVDGEAVATTRLRMPGSRLARLRPTTVRFAVPATASGEPAEVRILSSSFVPAELVGSDDTRRLGVPVLGIRVARGAVGLAARAFPILLTPPASLDWLDTYGSVVSISEYTREWVQRWWDRDTEVLHPPVTLHPRGEKQPIILNVGRFFAAERGHSKKQLEQVRAFRSLCDGGIRGWTLHLVGGCAEADRPYLEQVRREAAGYPVELHVDSPGAELQDLYAAASIYWHASGLGEDPRRHPDRMEHFGITTVEAMSAGAVPVVIGVAGQLETVRHGVDGFHFRHLDGLVDLSRRLIDDDGLREQMSRAGEARALEFSAGAFAARLDSIVDAVLDDDRRGCEAT